MSTQDTDGLDGLLALADVSASPAAIDADPEYSRRVRPRKPQPERSSWIPPVSAPSESARKRRGGAGQGQGRDEGEDALVALATAAQHGDTFAEHSRAEIASMHLEARPEAIAEPGVSQRSGCSELISSHRSGPAPLRSRLLARRSLTSCLSPVTSRQLISHSSLPDIIKLAPFLNSDLINPQGDRAAALHRAALKSTLLRRWIVADKFYRCARGHAGSLRLVGR